MSINGLSPATQRKEKREMTMQMKGVQIAGMPAINVRNMLRGVDGPFSKYYVAERLHVSQREANEIIKKLVAEGYLKLDEGSAARLRPRVSLRRGHNTRSLPTMTVRTRAIS